MPTPTTTSTTVITRMSVASTPVYSARPPHTPPSHLSVVLRMSRFGGWVGWFMTSS